MSRTKKPMLKNRYCRKCGKRGWLSGVCVECLDKMREEHFTNPDFIAECGHQPIESVRCSVDWCNWDAMVNSPLCGFHYEEVKGYGEVLPNLDDWLSLEDACCALGISNDQLLRMRQGGEVEELVIAKGQQVFIKISPGMREFVEILDEIGEQTS